MKALEEERADRRATEEAIRNKAFENAKEEAVADIVKFQMGFKCSALFTIRKRYLELDLSDVDLTLMERHNVLDLTNGSETQKGHGDEKALQKEAIADQPREEKV